MDETLSADQQPQAAQSRIGGRNLFQVIWQRRSLVVLGLVLGIVVGLLTYSQRTPMYRAFAQVHVVKKQDGNALQMASSDPRVQLMEDYVSTHMDIIKSQTVVTMAVKQFDLGSLRSMQGRDPVGTISAGLIVTRDVSKDSGPVTGKNIFTLSYSGTDPADVEKVLNAIIASYKDYLDKAYENTSNKMFEALQKAAVQLNTDLKLAQAKYSSFRKECPVLIIGDNNVPLRQSKLIEYEKKEIDLREQAEAIRKRIEVVQKAVDDKQPQDVILALAERRYEKGLANQMREEKENAAALERALLPLHAEQADLKNFFGKDHPAVLRIEERIKMTRESFNRIAEAVREFENGLNKGDPVKNVIQALSVEQSLITLNHDLMKGLLESEKKTARELETWYQQDKDYRDEIGRTEKVLDMTLNRCRELNLVRGYGGFDAKLLAAPSPGGRTSPILWQFLLIGAFMGVGLSCGVAYLLDLADKSFRTPDEIRRRLGLPIVGHVPFVPGSSEPVMMEDAAGNPVEIDQGLVALHQPMSTAAEGFRGIRTAIFFNTHGRRHNVIQVTSPNMGDGKTTLITNLAVSIAQTGRKVLIVDADLRRPRVHRAYGLTCKIGLAEAIAGSADLDEVIQKTVVPNLSVLPCGRRPQNPAELLTSPRFEDVIDDLRASFDFILVDTPPLLAVSDPCIVAPRMDGLLLTIRLSKNGRPAAERARDLLAGLKVNCIGVVVNGVGKHGSMTGYGYEHYKYSDDYTTDYTMTDELSHEEHGEQADSPARSEGEPEHAPVLPGSIAPSANGHSTHAHA